MSQQSVLKTPATRQHLPRRVRQTVLTLHVLFSVAWIGMNACLLVLAAAGLASDLQHARSAYLAMGLIGKTLILPISLGALVTGLVLSLGTPWGLFQHGWVVAKLAMTLALVGGHQSLRYRLQEALVDPAGIAGPDRYRLLGMLIGTLLVLVVATVLSVFKPAGRVRWPSTPST